MQVGYGWFEYSINVGSHTKMGISHTYWRAYKEIYLSGEKINSIFLFGQVCGEPFFPWLLPASGKTAKIPFLPFSLKSKKLFNCWILKQTTASFRLAGQHKGTFSEPTPAGEARGCPDISVTRWISRTSRRWDIHRTYTWADLKSTSW